MPKLPLSQKGFTHLLLFIPLVIGLGITIYLVTSKGFFTLKSKASSEAVSFEGPTVTFENNQYYTTSLQGVKLKLISPIKAGEQAPADARAPTDTVNKLTQIATFKEDKDNFYVRQCSLDLNQTSGAGTCGAWEQGALVSISSGKKISSFNEVNLGSSKLVQLAAFQNDGNNFYLRQCIIDPSQVSGAVNCGTWEQGALHSITQASGKEVSSFSEINLGQNRLTQIATFKNDGNNFYLRQCSLDITQTSGAANCGIWEQGQLASISQAAGKEVSSFNEVNLGNGKLAQIATFSSDSNNFYIRQCSIDVTKTSGAGACNNWEQGSLVSISAAADKDVSSFSEMNLGNNILGVAYAADYYTTSFKWAKSPNELDTTVPQPYDLEPKIIDYTFSNTSPGTSETVFVEFLGQGGEKARKQATITYTDPTSKIVQLAAFKNDSNNFYARQCSINTSKTSGAGTCGAWEQRAIAPVAQAAGKQMSSFSEVNLGDGKIGQIVTFVSDNSNFYMNRCDIDPTRISGTNNCSAWEQRAIAPVAQAKGKEMSSFSEVNLGGGKITQITTFEDDGINFYVNQCDLDLTRISGTNNCSKWKQGKLTAINIAFPDTVDKEVSSFNEVNLGNNKLAQIATFASGSNNFYIRQCDIDLNETSGAGTCNKPWEQGKLTSISSSFPATKDVYTFSEVTLVPITNTPAPTTGAPIPFRDRFDDDTLKYWRDWSDSSDQNPITIDPTRVYAGAGSLKLHLGDGSKEIKLEKIFSSSTNIVSRVFFYDAMQSNLGTLFTLKESADSPNYTGLGVHTPTSASNYAMRINNTFVDTYFPRSAGWHMFELIVTPQGTYAKIDNFLLRAGNSDRSDPARSNPSQTTASVVDIISSWGFVGDVFYDELSIDVEKKDPWKDQIVSVLGTYYDTWSKVSLDSLIADPSKGDGVIRPIVDQALAFYVYGKNSNNTEAKNKGLNLFKELINSAAWDLQRRNLDVFPGGTTQAELSYAAYVMRNDLDDATQKAVNVIIGREARRFLSQQPATSYADKEPFLRTNTQAEENGSVAEFLANAVNFFPNAFASVDEKTQVENQGRCFAYHTIIRAADPATAVCSPDTGTDPTGQKYPFMTIAEDFSLANHGDISGVYAFSPIRQLGRGALSYHLVGKPIPDEFKHNVKELYENFIKSHIDFNTYRFNGTLRDWCCGVKDSLFNGVFEVEYLQALGTNLGFSMQDFMNKRSLFYSKIVSEWIPLPQPTQITGNSIGIRGKAQIDKSWNTSNLDSYNWVLDTDIAGSTNAVALLFDPTASLSFVSSTTSAISTTTPSQTSAPSTGSTSQNSTPRPSPSTSGETTFLNTLTNPLENLLNNLPFISKPSSPAPSPTPAPITTPIPAPKSNTISYDLNNDGIVNNFDVSTFRADWDKDRKGNFNPRSDFNKDGAITSMDYSLLLKYLSK